MRITCPCCGERALEEFTYLGDANAKRPRDGGADATDEWVDYVYFRDNPAGPHRELWYHGAGCRSWLIVTRDTRNHAISDSIRAQGSAT
jgi:heterotetrameric sarcosine oxidase delta subunit